MNYLQSEAIKSWAESDRPREKLLNNGKAHLTEAELMAILIGSGNAKESAVALSQRILKELGNDLRTLSRMSPFDLMKFNGIGEAKSLVIIAALELGRRRSLQQAQEKQKINSSKEVFAIFSPLLGDLPHEEFWILLLNRANKVMSKALISKGGMTGTVVDPKIVFSVALERKSAAIILIHNHPSGNIKPSKADEDITRKLKLGGDQLDIPVLDHLIVTDSGYFSFADNGML